MLWMRDWDTQGRTVWHRGEYDQTEPGMVNAKCGKDQCNTLNTWATLPEGETVCPECV